MFLFDFFAFLQINQTVQINYAFVMQFQRRFCEWKWNGENEKENKNLKIQFDISWLRIAFWLFSLIIHFLSAFSVYW